MEQIAATGRKWWLAWFSIARYAALAMVGAALTWTQGVDTVANWDSVPWSDKLELFLAMAYQGLLAVGATMNKTVAEAEK